MSQANTEREQELQRALQKLKKEKRLMHKQLKRIKDELSRANTHHSSDSENGTLISITWVLIRCRFHTNYSNHR